MINPIPNIVEHTEAHPEDNAMLQALYSRSPASVEDHIDKVKKAGSGKFMSQFYLGYGHASIADCGNITIYIENVSMLCAKAFQDDPLYNGQECSSRYIDWSNQPFYNPCLEGEVDAEAITDSSNVLAAMREFYVTQKQPIIDHLKAQYPIKEDEKPGTYEKAINAKAFDILRGYLPCGATTSLSWTTSLRKANEHLRYLSTHPLKEIRDVSGQVHATLLAKYPNSIEPLPDPSTVDAYVHQIHNYYDVSLPGDDITYKVSRKYHLPEEMSIRYSYPDWAGKRSLEVAGRNRPKYSPVTKHDMVYRARMHVMGMIDFGSYRDLQRHRGGYCAVPMVFAQNGFHSWYYDQLPESSKEAANRLFALIEKFILDYNNEPGSSLPIQYLLPMGTLVEFVLDYDIRQAVYVSEIRSGQTVHATLRPLAQAMADSLREHTSIPIYADMKQDEWTLRRGTQDIVAKMV